MKFECIYEDINKALMSISKVNAKSSIFPIIELIHLEADDNMITFRSTNLEIILEISINAKVEVKGKIVINYANISKITNIVKSDILKVELIDNFLFIQSGKSKIKLQVSPYEDIPELPVSNISNSDFNTNNLSIDREIFINIIKSVSFSVANTDIKPEISSVYMYNSNSYLYTVATDTFRLAENRINISNIDSKINTLNKDNKNDSLNPENKISIMLPGKSVIILLSILDSLNSEKIEIENYDDGILISSSKNSSNTFIAIRTINGNFPDYKQLFPKDWSGIIILDKIALASNMSATMLFKDNYSYSNLSIKGNVLYIKTNNNNIGSYESEIEIKNVPVDINNNSQNLNNNSFEIEANYNSSLLLEGLSKIDGNTISIKFTSPNRPIFIKSENNNDFVYVLMPLNR